MMRNHKKLICLLFISFFISVNAAAAAWQIRVEVNKVVYLPGAGGQALVKINTLVLEPGEYTVKPRLEYGLDSYIDLAEYTMDTSGSSKISIPFTVPLEEWGYCFKARLFKDGQYVAAAQDVFAAGTNNYRLGQPSGFGGGLPEGSQYEFDSDNDRWPKVWRKTKGTTLELMAALPSEFRLKTDWPEWISMQGGYRGSKEGLKAFTAAAHRLGLKVMLYNNGTPSGWVGAEWARKYPEWLSYNYMAGLRADLRVEDMPKMKQWHRTMKAEDEVLGFQPFFLNFYDLKLLEFGCEQMLWAADNLGYDGVRFDGNWMLGDVWSGIGFDMEGRRPNRGESLDKINARNIRYIKEYIRERNPEFLFGYNYGNNYECGGARNPDTYRESCRDGGMILWELCAHNGGYSNWRAGARKVREDSLRVHQNGGLHFGQLVGASHSHYPNNDFYQRYIYITNFAAASHVYATVVYGHPGYRPIGGLYIRFALRFGRFLYDEDLLPIQKPEEHLAVTVNDREHPDLWWKLYTYKLQAKDRYYIITHLVNMPAEDVDKRNSTPDKQPPPIKNVVVDFARTPERIFVLDPEAEKWIESHESAVALTIAELKAWKIIIQEFSGSGAHIPTETIPEGDFKGKDILPDPKDGKTVMPVTVFLTGAEPGRLISTTGISGVNIVADESAQFGRALLCAAGSESGSARVLSGPNQVMPTVAPGRTRITWRLKVEDNKSNQPVCTVSGLFGKHVIKASEFVRPGAYQDFSYDYNVYENKANYLSLVFHYGVTDLWVDNLVSSELKLARDRDLFGPESLDVSRLPKRKAGSKKAHLCRGLWHEYFGLDAALQTSGTAVTKSWESISTSGAKIPTELPRTADKLMEYDLVALLNVSAGSLQPVRRKNLREYVLRGGTLFVGGGPRAYGHGGYQNTFLEEILPVEVEKFDLKKAEGMAGNIIRGRTHPLIRDISFQQAPHNFYYHKVKAKPGATVLLKTGNNIPLLTVWKKGAGTVYAFTGTPCGESENAVAWWQWDGWQTILDRIVAQASTD